MIVDWKDQARCDLLALRGARANWGYKGGGTASVEPSVLSSLALLASGNPDSASGDLAGARSAAEWTATIQDSHGSLPVSGDVPGPSWATPYAMLLWQAVPGFEKPRSQAAGWLLGLKGQALPRDEYTATVIGHDPTVRGWPWVPNTHSWVEPTALVVLALCGEGLNRHGRAGAGIHLLLNRSLESGGWNYGNPAVLGRALRAQPGPTGLALLALKAHDDDTPECRRAIDYLRRTLRDVRAGTSLSWGVLALRAWDACPPEAATWLAESHERHGSRADAVVSLALLLLAASERGLDLLIERNARMANDRASEPSPSPTTGVSS